MTHGLLSSWPGVRLLPGAPEKSSPCDSTVVRAFTSPRTHSPHAKNCSCCLFSWPQKVRSSRDAAPRHQVAHDGLSVKDHARSQARLPSSSFFMPNQPYLPSSATIRHQSTLKGPLHAVRPCAPAQRRLTAPTACERVPPRRSFLHISALRI